MKNSARVSCAHLLKSLLTAEQSLFCKLVTCKSGIESLLFTIPTLSSSVRFICVSVQRTAPKLVFAHLAWTLDLVVLNQNLSPNSFIFHKANSAQFQFWSLSLLFTYLHWYSRNTFGHHLLSFQVLFNNGFIILYLGDKIRLENSKLKYSRLWLLSISLKILW